MSYFEQTRIAKSDGTIVNPSEDESLVLLRRIAKLLESSAVTDIAQRQRVIAEQATAGNLNVTAAITGTPSVNATLQAATVNAGQFVVGFGGQASAAANIIDSRFFLIDIARTAYASGIRQNLVWA
jgi:hypothetical protein